MGRDRTVPCDVSGKRVSRGLLRYGINASDVNPLIATLKPQSNGQYNSNTVTGTLAVDGWAIHLVQRGGDWAGPQPAQAPPHCTKCNSPPINGQCTNFVLFDVALLPLESKGLSLGRSLVAFGPGLGIHHPVAFLASLHIATY